MNHWRILLVSACVALLSACAGLPHHPDLPQTTAIAVAEAAQTPLGKIATASLPQDGAASDSGFELLPVGPSALNARLALLERAEKTIDAQYYLIQKDGTGLAFLHALRAAAQRGVRVRLLVDDLFTVESEVVLRAMATVPHVEVRLFNPFANARFSNVGRFLGAVGDLDRVNQRMHNKLLVVDNAIAISGGRNIADEYFNHNTDSNFIDMDVMSAGKVVPQLSKAFDMYWNSVQVYPLETITGPPLPDIVSGGLALLDSKYALPREKLSDESILGGLVEPSLARGKLPLVPGHARVLVDVPSKVGKHIGSVKELLDTVNKGVLEVMESAQTEVIMMSPYFVPQQRHLDNMRLAIEQHKRVVVITNSIGSTDEPLVYAAYAKRRKAMLQSGVELYEINPEDPVKFKTLGDFRSVKGGLHAKVALIDRQRVFIGSMNLDSRSAVTNTELGMIIDSPALAQDLLRTIRAANLTYHLRLGPQGEIEWVELDDGREIVHTSEPNLGYWARFKLFLLSPLVSERLL
ncbi:MAG: phospholipase D family protein [Rhodoferax sp.]|jgi:putative cardiolipin synthase